MYRYVAGFLFSPDFKRVVLVKKNKPKWQKGYLNGVGGKIEDSENSYQAMVREFQEETGLKTPYWITFAKLYKRNNFELTFFYTTDTQIDDCKTMKEEEIKICQIDSINYSKCVFNLSWLIPLAIDKARNREIDFAEIEYW